jgi:hypothetical protein
MKKLRQKMAELGCEDFEVYEQVGANWSPGQSTGRFVQTLRFHNRRHFLAVQEAERNDPVAQELVREFVAMVDLPSQQQQGLYASSCYSQVLPAADRLNDRNEPTPGDHGSGLVGDDA